MDPVSTLFTAYINTVSQQITNNYRDNVNLDLTPVEITYQNENISFQHQIWRIKKESVCADLKQTAAKYSQCTIKAKSLFQEICNSLATQKNKKIRESRYQRMYCNAAIQYQPVIATISSEIKSTVSDLEKECNLLILKSMGSNDKKLKAEQNRICELAKK